MNIVNSFSVFRTFGQGIEEGLLFRVEHGNGKR
jgi:hypothetical protein